MGGGVIRNEGTKSAGNVNGKVGMTQTIGTGIGPDISGLFTLLNMTIITAD